MRWTLSTSRTTPSFQRLDLQRYFYMFEESGFEFPPFLRRSAVFADILLHEYACDRMYWRFDRYCLLCTLTVNVLLLVAMHDL